MNPEIETFLQSWRSLLEQGTTAGLGFTDKQHVVMLLAALPSTWRPFVTTQSYQTQSLAVLINKMRQEYAFTKLTTIADNNLNQSTIPIAMATTIPMSNQHQQQPHRFNKSINYNHQNQRTSLCNYCNKPGHREKDCRTKQRNTSNHLNTKVMTCNYCNRQGNLERECRTKQREVGQRPQARIAQLQQNPPSSGEEMYLFNTSLTKTTGLDLSWYLDTGTTHHMTFDKLYLTQYIELTTPLHVHLGDSSTRQAQGYGTLTFSLPNNNHLHIHKVYFVPGLTKNLLSVSQATECGYTLTFKGNSCLFESQRANGTSYTIPCFKTQNLYPIPITPIKISNASSTKRKRIEKESHTHGCCSINAKSRKPPKHLLGRSHGMIGPFTHLTFCEGCLFRKSHGNSLLFTISIAYDNTQLSNTMR